MSYGPPEILLGNLKTSLRYMYMYVICSTFIVCVDYIGYKPVCSQCSVIKTLCDSENDQFNNDLIFHQKLKWTIIAIYGPLQITAGIKGGLHCKNQLFICFSIILT